MSEAKWSNDCDCAAQTANDAKALYERIISAAVESGCADLNLAEITSAILEDSSACFGCLKNLVQHFGIEGSEVQQDQPPDSDENFTAVLAALSECAHACVVDKWRPMVISRSMSRAFGPQPVRKA